jgi:hypothetical protein
MDQSNSINQLIQPLIIPIHHFTSVVIHYFWYI